MWTTWTTWARLVGISDLRTNLLIGYEVTHYTNVPDDTKEPIGHFLSFLQQVAPKSHGL